MKKNCVNPDEQAKDLYEKDLANHIEVLKKSIADDQRQIDRNNEDIAAARKSTAIRREGIAIVKKRLKLAEEALSAYGKKPKATGRNKPSVL